MGMYTEIYVNVDLKNETPENKMHEVREEMKKRPSKIKHLNDLQRQVDHAKNVLSHYNELK